MKRRTEQKKKTMSFRISAAEAEAIQKQANAEGIPVSEMIREKTLSGIDYISSKKHGQYFAEQIMLAAAFRDVKTEIQKKGYQVNLDALEGRIYQSCL